MPKILHVSISSSYGGGPEHIYQLVSGLPSDFENYIACPDNGPYHSKFYNLVAGRITTIPFRRFEIKYLAGLYKYIKHNQIDLLHAHGKGAGLYCRLISMFMRIPVVYTPHGINQKVKEGFLNKLYIQFEKISKSLISAIIYVSQTEAGYGEMLNIWPGVKSLVIYNGTKTHSIQEINAARGNIRKNMGWGKDKVIITASRFDYQKNTIEFCEIAAKLPKLSFVILGDGIEMSHCQEYCAAHHIYNVTFVGAVPNPIAYFSAADIYLSTARWEGLSMAILESMAVGLPIIATRVIGNTDLVKHGQTGFLYDLGDQIGAVGYLLTSLDETTYLTLSSNAKEFHSIQFSSNSMCNNTASLYSEVLKQNK